jgi:8-oxo-dGTP diphosphatase
MPLYVCRRWDGTPEPRIHAALKWVRPKDMGAYPMPAADLPLIPMLRDLL